MCKRKHKGKNDTDLSCGHGHLDSGPCRALKVRDRQGTSRKCAPLEHNLHFEIYTKRKICNMSVNNEWWVIMLK